jgi:protein disulfide-isomerase
MHFKPTWQTLYEFYYTSKPPIRTKDDGDDDGQDGLNSFTRYYDFKIAKVDCIAFRDACAAHEVNNYPSIIQFRDGKEITRKKGAQPLPDLSAWVEEVLETVRPGSRVQGGPKLPKVGTNSVETGPATEGEAKEVQAARESATPSVKSEPTKVTKPTPAKPKSTANPSGTSEVFTPERFQEAVTNTLEPWFIKFYAPWCHHCQAMAPNWAQMAHEMQGKLNVGEVNCEEERKLCKDVGVKGYPTILFFRGDERIEYNGMRGLGDFIDYANNAVAVGSGIADVDAAEFKKMEETEEVIFTYFYDHATTSEDFQALERLTLSLVGQARLVKTNDKELVERFKISTWPRLMVSRDGKASYYSPIAPKDMRDPRKVLTWMKSVWLPIVPELKSGNAREIMDGKLVVLAILSRERSNEFTTAKKELKNAALEWIDREEKTYKLERQELRDAKNLRIEEAEDKGDQRALRAAKQIKIDMDNVDRRQVGFAWVDGAFWERWIRTTYGIDVKDGEKVIINDELVYPTPPYPLKLPPNQPTEPPLLGYHLNRGVHSSQPYLHPRNYFPNLEEPLCHSLQIYLRRFRHLLPLHPQPLHKSLVPRSRRCRRHCRRCYSVWQTEKEGVYRECGLLPGRGESWVPRGKWGGKEGLESSGEVERWYDLLV